MPRQVGSSLYSGLLLSVLGGIVWWSGQPFVFPSLGPSAFVLAFERRDERRRTGMYRIVASHVIGVGAGVLAWTLVNGDVPITAIPPSGSFDSLRLVGGATLSVMLTSWGMIVTETVHPPACATTLIVSLGILATPLQALIIVVSVVILVEVHMNVLPLFEQLLDNVPQRFGEDNL